MCQYPLSLLNNLISQWTSLKSPVRVYVPSPHPSVVASLFVSMLQTKTGISPQLPSLIAESFLHAQSHNKIFTLQMRIYTNIAEITQQRGFYRATSPEVPQKY